MTHFPAIQALAKFAQVLDDGAAQASIPQLIFTDHLEFLEGVDWEARALQEVLAIISATIQSAVGASPSVADRLSRALGSTACDVVRHGDALDTEAIAALYRQFVQVSDSYEEPPRLVAGVDEDIPF